MHIGFKKLRSRVFVVVLAGTMLVTAGCSTATQGGNSNGAKSTSGLSQTNSTGSNGGTLQGIQTSSFNNLNNYVAQLANSGGSTSMVMTCNYAGPGNYQIDYGTLKERVINGVQYNKMGNLVWTKSANPPAKSFLQQISLQMAGLFNVASMSVTKKGATIVAGRSANEYILRDNGASMATVIDVDQQTGVLLQASLNVSLTGSTYAAGPFSEKFTITQWGGVQPFAVPNT